jgi:hypothetical protein
MSIATPCQKHFDASPGQPLGRAGETFGSRIGRLVEQNLAGARPEEIDGSGEDALKAQLIIEAAIES